MPCLLLSPWLHSIYHVYHTTFSHDASLEWENRSEEHFSQKRGWDETCQSSIRLLEWGELTPAIRVWSLQRNVTQNLFVETPLRLILSGLSWAVCSSILVQLGFHEIGHLIAPHSQDIIIMMDVCWMCCCHYLQWTDRMRYYDLRTHLASV